MSLMKSRDNGFTLLELMIIMLVMALVMAVSYPSMLRGSTALHLRTTGRDVLNAFRIAREKAVTEQIRMMISVDPAAQKLVLSDILGDNARTYFLPPDVRIERITRAGTEIAQGPLIVRFLPNGSSDSAEILLESEAGSFLRIISDPITGGARIESGQGRNQP